MDELIKLLATRRDARVAVVGPPEGVSKYLGETEQRVDSAVLFVRGDLAGRQDEIERHDRPVVLAAPAIDAIPPELRQGLVVVQAPRRRAWWQRLFGG